jgi:ankyrin repeat protein
VSEEVVVKPAFLVGLLTPLLVSAIMSGASRDLRLVDAARARDTKAAERLIKQGVDVNLPQADGATALHWAAHWNDLALADALLRAGADPNAAEDGGVVPLALACINRSTAMVDRLLKAGANPNAGRETPVMIAARTGSADVMRLLLASGGDANAKEGVRGQTALMWAAAERHPQVVKLLLEHGANVNARTLVPAPSGRGGRGGGGGNPLAPQTGPNGFTPILFAARVGDLESARLLVDAGANVNDAGQDGMSPLVLATVRAHRSLAMYLLDKGANPNADGAGYTALHWASGSWETELSVTSITSEREGEWATIFGLREGRLELVEALLAHGANPNARIRRTPARVGSSKNPGLRELEGATPFVLAAMAGATDVMRALIEHGADPRLRTTNNGTALMAAGGLGRVIGEVLVPESETLAAAKYVLELGGADIDAVDTLGNTALHYAAFFRRDSIVELLAKQGAALGTRNVFGETPLWLSEVVIQFAGGGRWEIQPTPTGELLRTLGATPIQPPYTLRHFYWPDQPHV